MMTYCIIQCKPINAQMDQAGFGMGLLYVGYRVRILYRKGSRSASGKEDCWSWKSFWLMVLLSQNLEMESLSIAAFCYTILELLVHYYWKQ